MIPRLGDHGMGGLLLLRNSGVFDHGEPFFSYALSRIYFAVPLEGQLMQEHH